MMKKRSRAILLGSVCLFGIQAQSAVGQELNPANPAGQAEAPPEAEAIVVTGSRLRNSNDLSPQPIVGINATELARSGGVTASDIINELPQLGNAFGSNSQDINSANRGFNVGTELINLRGLGPQRTLVLVNGRRHVASDPGTSAVDLNAIPSAMIERIEIVTGANSAVYGADAVSGVANIILRKRYDGTLATFRAGITDEGDGAEYSASLLHGGTVGDRLNFLASVEYSRRDGFLGRDRDWVFGDGSNTSFTQGAGSSVIDGGRFQTAGPAGIFTYPVSGGRPAPFTAATPLFQRVLERNLQVPVERALGSVKLDYEVSDKLNIFAEGTFARSVSRLDFESQFFQFRSNVTSSQFDLGPIPSNAPGLADFLAATGASGLNQAGIQTRRFSEYGPRSANISRNLYRGAIGAEGDLGRFNYQIYYQYGRVDTQQEDGPAVDRNRFYAGVNNCAGAFALPGCVPINVFGGVLSQAAIDYTLIPEVKSKIRSEQHVVSGFVAGNLLDLFGSPLGVVIGAEYRDESTRSRVHPSLQDGSNAIRQISATSGGADVKEVFGEARLPLFDGLFEVGGAARISDYSTVGTEVTWNGNLSFTPSEFIRFRASYGKATRAPNVNELFSSITSSTATLSDPCANDRAPQDGVPDVGVTPPASCVAQLGAGYVVSQPPNATTLSNRTGGNPNLRSETGKTLVVGAVVTAPRLLNLSLSVDYFDIKLSDVIGTLSTNQVVNECYVNQPGLPDTFCGLITRAASGNRAITTVTTQLFNIASERARGLDVQARIGFPALGGRVSVNANYSHLFERSRQEFSGAPTDDFAGRFDAIRDQGRLSLSFDRSPFLLVYEARVLGGALKGTSAANRLAVDDPALPGNNGNRIGTYIYHDFQASIDAGENFTFSFGAKNLFDKKPPLITDFANSPSATAANVTAGGIYDVRGRFFYTRVTAKF